MANQNMYFDKEIGSDYSGVSQRWLVVFLQAALELELKIPAKAQAIEQEVAEKLWPEVSQLVFNCWEE